MLRNTAEHYGAIARLLHWTIALLILGSYCSVYYRHWFTERQTPENLLAVQAHMAIGISVGGLVLLRVIWRLLSRQPLPVPGTPFELGSARLMHALLYFFIIAMPATGYLGASGAIDYFGSAAIPSFRDTAAFARLGMEWKEFEKPFDAFHKFSGKYLVWVLIVLHASAALHHHFVRRDAVLRRMLGP